MSRDDVNRSLAGWLRSQEATPTYLEDILTRTRHQRQRPAWSFPERWLPMQSTLGSRAFPRLPIVVTAMVAVAIAVAVGVALLPSRSPSVGGPGTSAGAASASPSPAATPRPSSAGPEHRPVAPESPLPSPEGAAIHADLVGREYSDRDPAPSASQQQLVLTLRAASDPHCVAMFGGTSTCFTILWEPNTAPRQHDPGARGPARVVDGQLVLTFAIVPHDLPCEGLEYVFAVEDDGSRLRGVVVPEGGCGFPSFFER